MPHNDLTQTLASPEAQWTIAGLGIVLVLMLAREVPKIPRQLLMLMATAFVDMLGLFLVVPLLPFYCKRLVEGGVHVLGLTLGIGEVTGLVMATFTVAQLISAPMWGRFSDRYGRRPALLIALGASAAGYVIFGFADSLWMLLLSRIVQGAGGGTVGVIQAYVADSVPPEERARSLGWLSAATNLGVALGPVLGSQSVSLGNLDLLPGEGILQMGSAAPGLAAAVVCVVNMIFAARLLRESHTNAGAQVERRKALPALVEVVTHPMLPAARLLLIYGVAIGAGQGINAVMAHLLDANFQIGEQEIGTVYTYIGAISVFARVLVLGRLLDRFGEARLSRIGTLLLSGGLMLLPFAHSLGTLALAVGLLPLGTALLFPCVSALLSRVVPATERGMYLGLQQTFGGAARCIAPISFGYLFDRAGHPAPFVVASMCVLLTMPLGFGLHQWSKQRASAAAKPAP
ncbi:MAG: MFS transporter [Planctomycetes bacterium]|nr:MFS transporter [Planctomycetota bacterium]